MDDSSDTGLSQADLALIKADLHAVQKDVSTIRAALSRLVFGASAGSFPSGDDAPLERLIRALDTVASKLPGE